jgi:hypothetical protein
MCHYWPRRVYLAALRLLALVRAKLPSGLAPLNGLKLHDPDRRKSV